MKVASRLSVSFIPGAVITFLMLVLMFSLIVSSNTELIKSETRKIGDIFQPPRQVVENIKESKPEKPEDPATPPPQQVAVNETFEVPDNAISMAAPKLDAGLNVGLDGFVSDSDYIPVYVPQPMYPRRAQSRGVGGYAVVEVTITTTGAVRDPKMVEEHPTGYGFGAAAVKAAEKLKYNPRVVSGVPQEVPGVLYKFSFVIE
jgi:protein TonB